MMDLQKPVIPCVDDEAINPELFKDILAPHECKVITATSGQEALLKVKSLTTSEDRRLLLCAQIMKTTMRKS